MTVNPLHMDKAAAIQPLPARRGTNGAAGRIEGETQPVPRDQVLLSVEGETSYARKQISSGQREELANAIRKRDEALQGLSQNIVRMKIPLETIVKNFPPFTSEDRTRMKLLREYAAIRKEIDRLTFPPPPEIAKARKALALPAPLPPDVTDSQIGDYLVKLDAAATEIGAERAALAAATDTFLRKEGSRPRLWSLGRGGFTSSVSLWSDAEAGWKSAEVGRQFANSVRQGVTAKSSQFLRGMS